MKGSIFFVVVVICIQMCNWAYLRTDTYDGVSKFQDVPKQIDVCNLGASHSMYGFNYEDYEGRLQSANFGLGNQSHVYDYHILQYYSDHLKKGSIIFIVVSYPMIIGKSEYTEYEWMSKNLRYYRFLPPKYIRKFDRKTWLEMKCVPFIHEDNILDLFKSFLKSSDDKWEQEVKDAKEIENDAHQAYLRHIGVNKSDENGNIIYLQEAIDAIYDMIDLCRKKEAIPILITPPFTDVYMKEVKKYAPDYCNHGFYDVIEKIRQDTGVEYYDYSSDKRFSTSYNMFMNSDHLNKEGARKFTDIVMEEVVGDRLKK